MTADSLGDRMKSYENQLRLTLVPRMPTIIRVDGKAFHTYCAGLEPFDGRLIAAMNETAIALCEEIQTAVFAFVQSDEISVLLHPYKRYATQAWFDGGVQKIVSVAASIATAAFNDTVDCNIGDFRPPAHFDARVWVLPESEVCNYFIWRQQDWTRNSVQMLARSLYSHRELHGMNTPALHEMIHARGKNWNDLPTSLKRGRCVTREVTTIPLSEAFRAGSITSHWVVDSEPPIFTQDRAYIERHLAVESEEAA